MLISQTELWSLVAIIFIAPLAVGGAILLAWMGWRKRYRPEIGGDGVPRSGHRPADQGAVPAAVPESGRRGADEMTMR
jgi:hypothetical protein